MRVTGSRSTIKWRRWPRVQVRTGGVNDTRLDTSYRASTRVTRRTGIQVQAWRASLPRAPSSSMDPVILSLAWMLDNSRHCKLISTLSTTSGGDRWKYFFFPLKLKHGDENTVYTSVLAEKFKMLLLVVTSDENRSIMKFLANMKICILNRENVRMNIVRLSKLLPMQ